MQLHLDIPWRSGLAVLCGTFLMAGIWASPARADQWDKKTILTVRNQPIQIRETVLEPGQYVLRLLDSQSDRPVVQIFNSDQSHIINTVLAIPATRMEPSGQTEFTFWETPPGTARAMRRWYYPGDNMGQEFPYPKHLEQIAMVTNTTALVSSTSTSTSESTEASNAQPAPEQPAVQPEPTPEPAPAEQPTEIAQNSTPATPPPAEPPPAAPAELPKTGTLYPLIGISGGLLLGLYLMIRLRRHWA